MRLAIEAASRSEDPYLQVGCCILRKDHTVASLGYNGPPPGIEVDWSDRDKRRKRMVHAEINCLRNVRVGEGDILAVTLSPCLPCLTAIASWGIKKVFYKDIHQTMDPDMPIIAKEFGMEVVQLPVK